MDWFTGLFFDVQVWRIDCYGFLKEHIYGVLSYRNAQLNFAEIEYDVLQ